MTDRSRRRFLVGTAAGLAAGCAHSGGAERGKAEAGEDEVTPAEDLMREHGVLNRILLIYDEGVRRIDAGEELPGDVIASAAGMIKTFIEDYHERLEETQLFPRFETAGKLVDLVAVLRGQHQAGRAVTAEIQQLAGRAERRKDLAVALRKFTRMYRPHEAREDTELFPALHEIIPAREYAELGERFEDEEHRLFGEGGFEKNVAEVGRLEEALGIHDLAKFTP